VSIVNAAQKRDGTINNESIVTKTVQNWNNEFLIEETDAKNNITRYTMDLIGRITNVLFADGTVMTYSYYDSYAQYSKGFIYVDVKDQEQINKSHAIKRIKYPDDTELATGYNYSGFSTYMQTLKDANGTVTTYTFDVLGRLVAVTEPATVDASTGDVVALPHTTTYDYDTLGNLLSFTDAKNRTTSYQYDLMNRLVLETYPDNSTFSYGYDKNNNIIHKVDARGVHIKYDYDSLNRLYKIYVDNNNGISHIALNEKAFFEYDLNGNRTFARNEHSSAEFMYNNRNWLTSETRTIEGTAYTFGYTYNTTGDLLTTSYPSGYKSYNSVDTLHRVLNVKYSKPGESILNDIVGYNYHPMGTISNIINANGVNQDFLYDLRDRVTQFFIYRQSEGRDTPILWQRYEYDKVGNRIADNTYESEGRGAISEYMAKWKINALSQLGARVNYSYDSLYRLTGVHYPGNKPHKDNDQIYKYDSVGNRMRHEFELGEHDFEYNNLNQLTKMIVNHGEAGTNYYSWDLNGSLVKEEKYNLLGKVSEKKYQWDYDNKLVRADAVIVEKVATNQQDGFVSFKHDFDGRRIQKRTGYGPMVTKLRTYVKGMEEYDLHNQIESVYIGTLRINGKTNVEFMHKDVLGSTVLITGSQAEKLERNKFDPFGEAEFRDTKTDNDKLFTGHEYVSELGLTLPSGGERPYDAVVGRWIGRDTVKGDMLNPQNLNRYLYVVNKPLNNIDPDGYAAVGLQVRNEQDSRLIVLEFGKNWSFNIFTFVENAPRTSPVTGEVFGQDAQLPPGVYDIEGRVENGTRIPQGQPVYTTPGQSTGDVLTPQGNIRGESTGTGAIGPHPGSVSAGCPLLPNNTQGAANREQIRTVMSRNQKIKAFLVDAQQTGQKIKQAGKQIQRTVKSIINNVVNTVQNNNRANTTSTTEDANN